MMEEFNMETLNLLINAGVAGVFAMFAIILIREFINHLKAQNESWQSFLAAQNESWRKFLEEQRSQNNAALGRLAEEIKEVGVALVRHDERAREFISESGVVAKKKSPTRRGTTRPR